ncbi:YggS family pyridoxal phosphate-dependent enzyme [Variovorax sp. HJSM1_2]|uniref:YggS family pyridoxal phosphate-dependent enzyme n=1 Tax=Variovorax sp. HJSM1_2 TaxID=3366263 RepID=UPI003BBA12D0
MTTIGNKLQGVRDGITTACAAAGRPADSVRLLAVSKTFGPDDIREAHAAGQTDFGENYIQEALEKIAALRDLRLVWHCIGPVQSNKSRLVAEHFDWLHTVGSQRLAQRLSDQRPAALAPLQVCVQVNIDGGATKAGVAAEDTLALCQQIAGLPRLQLRGLMTIPEPHDDPAAQLAVHQRSKALFDALGRAERGSPGWERFDTLSMGMTADMGAAIQAGSTMVRVGSAIFGGRAPQR